MRHHTTIRTALTAIGALAAAALVVVIAPAASAAPAGTGSATGDPAAGAAFLVRQLTGGDHVESSYTDASGKVQTFVDDGGTADVAIALASTGTQDATLARIVDYLDAHVADYVDPTGAQGGPYDGAAGKLALVNEIVERDPRDVGGTDLLALLTSHVCPAATSDGACSAAGDFHGAYSGLGQVLPVLALARAGATVPAAALTRLDQLQCSDGGFSSDLIAPGASCTSDVDTTGAVLQALASLPSQTAAAQQAAQFLLAQQQPDGGFVGAAGENANSTALAVQGLIADAPAGHASPAASPRVVSPAAVANGQAFLAALQQPDGGVKVTAAGTGSDLRATDQSVPALAGATWATLAHAIPAAPAGPAAPTSPAATFAPAGPTATGAAVTTATGTTIAAGTLPSTGGNTGRWARTALELMLIGSALVTAGWRLRRRTRSVR